MFQNATNVAVFGGAITEVHSHDGLNGRQILFKSGFVVQGAAHDSAENYSQSQCHPDTRKEIVDLVLKWVGTPLEESKSQIFWIHGPAGVGKTAIAQTLCQHLKALGRLGGSFFLSRLITGQSNPRTLFPTLAYQLAIAYPEFGREIDTVIQTDESILTKTMERQLDQLIADPLQRVETLPIPLVFLIDGLDEAGLENDQTSIIQLLGSRLLPQHYPLKIIVTSRPEPWINDAFASEHLRYNTQSYFLHHTSETDNDIRIFLKSGFEKIRSTHERMRHESKSWPSDRDIEDLVKRSSGQFIFASTILRYLEDPSSHPAGRLKEIMRTMASSSSHRNPNPLNYPFRALDNLYIQVLSTSSNIDLTLAVLGATIAFIEAPRATRLLDTAIAVKKISSHSHFRDSTSTEGRKYNHSTDGSSRASGVSGGTRPLYILDWVELVLNLSPGDGASALRTVLSLIDISSTAEGGVKFYHKSFQDFLLDSNRSGKYFIDINKEYSNLILWALKRLKDFGKSKHRDETRPKKIDNVLLQFILDQWKELWLRSATSLQDKMIAKVKSIDKTVFYFQYARNVAGELGLLFNKRMAKTQFLMLRCYKPGNIAESILLETRNSVAPSPAWARLLAAEAVFEKYLTRILQRTDRGGFEIIQKTILM